MDVARPLRQVLLVIVAVGCAACGRMQPRTPPPVAMLVPPPPPRVTIPVSISPPEEPVVEPEPEPPSAPPTAPPRARPETAPPRTVIEKPVPPPATAAADAPSPLQTTANVGALAQRASWLIGQAEKDLERINLGQLIPQERAQFDRARSFIRNARSALQNKNFNYAEQLADKAFKLARALIKA